MWHVKLQTVSEWKANKTDRQTDHKDGFLPCLFVQLKLASQCQKEMAGCNNCLTRNSNLSISPSLVWIETIKYLFWFLCLICLARSTHFLSTKATRPSLPPFVCGVSSSSSLELTDWMVLKKRKWPSLISFLVINLDHHYSFQKPVAKTVSRRRRRRIEEMTKSTQKIIARKRNDVQVCVCQELASHAKMIGLFGRRWWTLEDSALEMADLTISKRDLTELKVCKLRLALSLQD